MRIQHNIMAMSAYRNYNTNTSAVAKNLEKLSSGYKINRAGDDAAGLAISEKMRAQITGLSAAQKNVKDGISLVKTAEGAMQEIQDMLNRMDYLATQSANGTYDNEVDRAALQKEVEQLKSEINRIADSANFNGIKLLDGSMDGNARAAVEAAESTAAGMLPSVGQILGKDTVLHAEAGTAPDKTSFSVDLHNLKISGAKGTEFNITIGDVTLTGTLAKDFAEDAALTADDIAAALADSTATTNVSFKVGTAAYDSTNFTVNGAKFSVKADESTGSRVTFESDESVDPEMKVSVALSNKTTSTPDAFTITATPAGKAGAFTAGTVTTGATATVGGNLVNQLDWTSNTAADQSAHAGKTVSVTIGGQTFTTKLVANGAGTAGATDEVELAAAGTDEDPAELIGKIKANLDAQIAAYNTEAAKGKTDYTKIENLTWTAGNKTITAATATTTAQTFDATAGTDTAATSTIDFGTNTGADVLGKGITIGGKTYEFVADAADVSSADNVAVVIADTDTATQLATKLKTELDKDTAYAANLAAANGTKVDGSKLVLTGKDKDSDLGEVKEATAAIDAPKLKGDYNVSTTNLEKKGEAAGERLASTYFNLSKAMAANGNQITIGKTTYTFTTDEADKGKLDANADNKVYVGDLDLSKKEDLIEAADRLTKVANGNSTYTVGHDGTRMTFTEIKDQTDFVEKDGTTSSLTSLEAIEKSFGFKTAGKEAVEADDSKALTLQIGDTSESYNQLKVSIGDMHTDAMGIADLNIGNQTDAAAAIQTIRDAINYVSGVRGDLGATQNRLEHTANNLSVMAENIQDAESTIRDTDIAEEMMSYTKNNILVQSAQAMLAQANQVPQGVLQLLG